MKRPTHTYLTIKFSEKRNSMNHAIWLAFVLLIAGCTRTNENEITASGVVETTEVTVSAKIGGEVMKLFVEEGASVRKGDTLALIDQRDVLIQLRQAQANAAAMDAQLRLIRRGSREEDILQTEASFTNAREDLKRAEELFKVNTITQKQLDDARTRFIVAQQSYEKIKRGATQEEIDMAAAKRDLALAQLEAIEKKISDTYVTAPVDGTITQKAIESGDIVVPNGALFRITQLQKVHLMIYVSEVELASVIIGQDANVYIDAYPDKAYHGKVIWISDKAEFTPKNVQTKDDRTKLVFGVKIEVPNPDLSLKPGMPADAIIHITPKKNS